MNKSFFILVILIGIGGTIFSQSTGYPVSLINDSLKLNANAVIREELTEYTFITTEKNLLKTKKVITVLNRNGDRRAVFTDYYDKLRSITGIKVNIYDATGKLIRKVKASEIDDVSGSDGFSEFDDLRYKIFKPLISIYPYTVEFEYEVEIHGSYYFPIWHAFDAYNVSIEKKSLRIIVPVNYQLNYKVFNIRDDCFVKSQTDINAVYTWELKNLKPIEHESYSGDLIKFVPSVYTAPSTFSLEGFAGNMNTWNDYAIWQQKLNAGRDILSDTRINEIRQLVKDIPGDSEKVERLYNYLQERTRYFGIQLGIGGLQPMEAKKVDEIGYSDCKGLSNYMKALLKAVGIESYYAKVHAGEDFQQMITDFPSHQTNHIILCVPIKNDTIWLECTDQLVPFGFLGSFTSDRHVLLIKENGGELVRTPVYSLNDNFQYTRANVSISSDGNGTVEILRHFGGLQYDDKFVRLHNNPLDQKEWLYKYYPIPNFQLKSFEFKNCLSEKSESILKSSIILNKYATVSGKRLFLLLNLTNPLTEVPPKIKTRLTDISQLISFIDADTIEYSIPEGLTVEFLPEDQHIKTSFGEYVSRVTQSNNKLIYFRQLQVYKGTFPKEQYEAFIKFYYDISVADKCQAILIKKES